MNTIARIYGLNRCAIRLWLNHDIWCEPLPTLLRRTRTILRGLCIAWSVLRREKHRQRLREAGQTYEHLVGSWWELWWVDPPPFDRPWLEIPPEVRRAILEGDERVRRERPRKINH